MDAQQCLYSQIDPLDFRVGHRYKIADPGSEHDCTVCRVTLIGDRVLVETFDGKSVSHPVTGPCFVLCDVQGEMFPCRSAVAAP